MDKKDTTTKETKKKNTTLPDTPKAPKINIPLEKQYNYPVKKKKGK